jgi:hypothetical protein
MADLSRLEVLFYRLEAQHACLRWAFGEIEHRPGLVFEMGLGHGRTFDHLRRNLPGRDIYVFDREVDCFPDCAPAADRLFRGQLADTLPKAASQFAGKVVLAHSDMGSYDPAKNEKMRALVSRDLPSAIAPGGLILSDLPLEIPAFAHLPLPQGAREGRYHIYRKPG